MKTDEKKKSIMKAILKKKGKGGPGGLGQDPNLNMNASMAGSNTPPTMDPTMGGTISPAGATPITPTNPSAQAPQGTPSLPSTIAPLPRLRAGMGKSMKPSRFSAIRTSAKFGRKTPGNEKGALTKQKTATLKGSIRKTVGTRGRSPSPMSSMAKMPSFNN